MIQTKYEMTPQIGEIFRMEGEQYFIDEQPLHAYFLTLRNPPHFKAPSPTCWRGYYGKWELKKMSYISFISEDI